MDDGFTKEQFTAIMQMAEKIEDIVDGNDFFDHAPGHRLDVGRIGHVRIGHDGGRIRIDQNDAITLFAQRLAGLCPGIIEFAGLADDDRAGADDQDAFDVSTFRHVRPSPCCGVLRSMR